MKIIILTEGGRQTGFGQIIRCVSLGHAFREIGENPIFFVNGDDTANDLLVNYEFKIFDWIKNEKELFSLLKDAAIVVVDSYFADIIFYKKISEMTKIPIFIDDTIRLDYPRGIVVNGAIYAEKLNYPPNKDVDYLLGIRFFPLRQEFWDIRPFIVRRHVKSILLTVGGSDIRNLIPFLLTFLSKYFSNLNKKIIVGKGCNNFNEIRKAADQKTQLLLNPEAHDQKKAILASDLAISGAGQTLYELANVGIPTIAIQVIENQKYNVRGLKKVRAIEYAGSWENINLLNNINTLINKLESIEKRKEMSLIGKKLINGNGSRRIVQRIWSQI